MAISLRERFKHAWNVFKNRDPTEEFDPEIGAANIYRPDRVRMVAGGERTIVNSIYTRIANDAAAVHIVHAKLDENGRFIDIIDSGLNNCLTVEANIDQTGRAFIQDAVLAMLDTGVVALVPVDVDDDPDDTGSYNIYTMRVGRITEWYPEYVKVNLYNDRDGLRHDILVSKRSTAIIENPFYPIMNDRNSTMQRLIRKLSLLDAVDEENSSAKMNLIVQLPYAVKTDLQKKQAEARRQSLETQLNASKYGIAYSDATEKIVQLNRPLENNLLDQIKYLTDTVMSQLGLDVSILNCTANEVTMLRYYDGIIEPIVSALCDGMKRTFLTANARTRRQSVIYYRDPFKLVPVSQLANLANAFTRNEIVTSNEIRQILGMKPSSDPTADELRNKNLYPEEGTEGAETAETSALPDANSEEFRQVIESMTPEEFEQFMQNADEIDKMLDELENEFGGELKHYGVGQFNYDTSDPEAVYQHEKYMERRELKGGGSSGLNDAGKAAIKSEKSRIDSAKKREFDRLRDVRDATLEKNAEDYKRDILQMQNSTLRIIESYRRRLKLLPRGDDPKIRLERYEIYKEIDYNRQSNREYKERARQIRGSSDSLARTTYRADKQSAANKFEDEYSAALERIKSDPTFQKQSKSSSSKTKSSTSSKTKSSSKSKKETTAESKPKAQPRNTGPSKFDTDLAAIKSIGKKRR